MDIEDCNGWADCGEAGVNPLDSNTFDSNTVEPSDVKVEIKKQSVPIEKSPDFMIKKRSFPIGKVPFLIKQGPIVVQAPQPIPIPLTSQTTITKPNTKPTITKTPIQHCPDIVAPSTSSTSSGTNKVNTCQDTRYELVHFVDRVRLQRDNPNSSACAQRQRECQQTNAVLQQELDTLKRQVTKQSIV